MRKSLQIEVGIRVTKGKQKDIRAIKASWISTKGYDKQSTIRYKNGKVLAVTTQLAWDLVPTKDNATQLNFGQANGRDNAFLTEWADVPAKDQHMITGWNQSIKPRDIQLRILYTPIPAKKDLQSSTRFYRCNEHGKRFSAEQELRESLYLPHVKPLVFDFKGKRYTPNTTPFVYFDFRYIKPTHAIQPTDSMGDRIRWGTARQIERDWRIRWKWGRPCDPRTTGITYPDYVGPIIVIPEPEEPIVEDSYVIGNSVEVVVLPDRTPIEFTTFTLSLDIDSFSWGFSGSLLGKSALLQIKPDASGQKLIEAKINGHIWQFIIESYSRDMRFANERYSVRGASRTQYLAAPYALKTSAVNAVDITARQASEDLLLNTGFVMKWDSINENPVDWTITAGALSYLDQTPIEVISRIAESIGAVVKPAKAGNEFSVLPRYRDAVWNWDNATVDRIIPTQIVPEIGGEWTPQPQWNSCYVSGINFGVAVDVRRAGTAGDQYTTDVYDDLITDTAAARARGIAEICKGGNQEIVTLNMPLFPEQKAPGLIEPAMLCEFRSLDEGNWRGLCLSTEIDVSESGTRVVQTIKLERHHGNR
ncbi:hypothetical protein VQ643_15980 [Pseudomonas sp. F1_0610]|uniref:hypothetical protein n=1 Tax=Pseudomonas sp. F1_0610 TaxID=3114284 RepID=UPI0039C2B082